MAAPVAALLLGLHCPAFARPSLAAGPALVPAARVSTPPAAMAISRNIGSVPAPKVAMDVPSIVVIRQDFSLAHTFLAAGSLLTYVGSPLFPLDHEMRAFFFPGIFILALGIIFHTQTRRLRFVLGKSEFEIMKKGEAEGLSMRQTPEGLTSSGNNVVVGGANRWKYSSVVNWEFFPKGFMEAGLPVVLVYFKETQTRRGADAKGPGAWGNSINANYVAPSSTEGQVHFCPAFCDCKELDAVMQAKTGKKRVG